jgi:hypothetical protein
LRRFSYAAALVPLLFVLACGGVRANTLVRLAANHIGFYYDRFLIEADGNVRIQTSDGFQVTGDTMSMDLKLNRFLIAGHVTLTDKSGRVSGAALADFMDFNRLYFVPVTTEPDRWTFLDGDLAHPVKGRVMPGDTFYFPSGLGHPSLSAGSAVIGTKTYVRFMDVTQYVAGAGFPLKSFVVNFSSKNQYFAQNSLAGANFDLTWNLAGNDNALSAIHFREDSYNGFYLSFEQHLVGEHDYAIFSINPFTKFQKFYSLDLYELLGSRFQIQTYTQYYVGQHLFEQPQGSATWSTISATYAFPHSFLTAVGSLTNYNLLSDTIGTSGPAFVGNLSHPTSLQLTDTSFQNRIGNSPFYEQVRVGYGFNHDSVGLQYPRANGAPVPSPSPIPGLQAYGNCPQPKGAGCPTLYTTIYNALLGYTLSMQNVKLGDHDNPFQVYYLNGSFDQQETWNSLPHRVKITTSNLSLSRQFSRQLSSYLQYTVSNTGDYYLKGGYQTPPQCFIPAERSSPAIGGGTLCSFTGVSTLRTLSLGTNFQPNPDFITTVTLQKHDDFPIPTPGLFPVPTLNVIGQPLYSAYLGQPPYNITADIRFKVLPHLMVDVGRTFYFNGTPGWNANYVVQFLPLQ